MQISADVELSFPLERVFRTYRDRLPELTPYLPNIRSIEVKSRREAGGVVELVNEWAGGADIPKVARAILSESMLRWTDFATWHESTFTCDWRTEVHAFPGAVKSSGRNVYLPTERGVRLEIRGDITCDASKVPGVPRIFARAVNGAVEKILVGAIKPNLVAVAEGVGKLLEDEDEPRHIALEPG
ncbi:MAG: hypothetical protein HY908_37035 [Myxococcales bacterium]|nr:hypothetical protein [Myxococcales bacterium]